MAHLGYCAIHGYRVGVPYLLQDIVDHTHLSRQSELTPFTAPLSVDINFMAEDDQVILSATDDFAYWWKDSNDQAAGNGTNFDISSAHFTSFLSYVTQDDAQPGSTRSADEFVSFHGDVAGFANRPLPHAAPATSARADPPPCSADLPLSSAADPRASSRADPTQAAIAKPSSRAVPPSSSSAEPQSTSSAEPPCPRCNALGAALAAAFEKVEILVQRVNGELRQELEGVHQSAAMVGAYQILGEIHKKAEKLPFEGGRLLPKYRKDYPWRFVPLPYKGEYTEQVISLPAPPPGQYWISPPAPTISSASDKTTPPGPASSASAVPSSKSAGTSLSDSASDSSVGESGGSAISQAGEWDHEIDDVQENQQ